MKKILLALAILAPAGVWLYALNHKCVRERHQFDTMRDARLAQAQQLAEVQAEALALTAKVQELKNQVRRDAAMPSLNRALVDFLLSNDVKSASVEMQDKLLEELRRSGSPSGGYVLVSKAALTNSTLKPLKNFPNSHRLTDAVRGVLAITPEEQQSVEAAFTEDMIAIAAWAKANVLREGPSDEMLARYTIPTDATFRTVLDERLFSKINSTIGDERTELMRKFFDTWRYREDGAIADRTNVLSIHRISEQPGFGYRSGWKGKDWESINTYPEPIKPKNCPTAFLFVFPGGWQEIAQREGFRLPESLQKSDVR